MIKYKIYDEVKLNAGEITSGDKIKIYEDYIIYIRRIEKYNILQITMSNNEVVYVKQIKNN